MKNRIPECFKNKSKPMGIKFQLKVSVNTVCFVGKHWGRSLTGNNYFTLGVCKLLVKLSTNNSKWPGAFPQPPMRGWCHVGDSFSGRSISVHTRQRGGNDASNSSLNQRVYWGHLQ